MRFKHRIKDLRQSKGWSQQDFASRLGVAQSVIARYESGQKMASSDTLIDIANLFGVSIDYLLGMSNEKFKVDSTGKVIEADLIQLTETIRPKLNGIPVTDDEWEMITFFLGSVVKKLESQGRIPKE